MNQGGQKVIISINGTMTMVLAEETPTSVGTMMATIDMKESLDITTMLQVSDQLGVPIAKRSLQELNKKSLIKIVLGGSPGTVECSAGSEAKIELGSPKICAIC